ncbi:glycosyltransferase [Vibrio sp. 10N.247.311.59]|uniref:glycosyltransferase n=1 Tax=Vibrio sp. 10N.247.311.59 TaxID=3229989 RepID=UPI003553F365
MKIMYVITGLGVGGAEKIVCNLIDKLTEEKHEAVLVYLRGDKAVLPKNSSVKVYGLGLEGPLDLFSSFWKLRKLIRKYEPSVVHSHMFHANILCRLVRPFTDIRRLISSVHNTTEGGIVRSIIYRLTDKLTDVTTNVSDEAVKAYIDKKATPFNRILAIKNGIDTDNFSPKDKSQSCTFRLISVGSLTYQKDYPNLLGALHILKNDGVNFNMRIVGDGPLKEQIYSLAEKLDLCNEVNFVNHSDSIPALLNESDGFVLASRWEGFGLVVAEAMACELPVVATNCGGVAEVLGDPNWLVVPEDAVILSTKIKRMIGMSLEERIRLGKLNRQRVIEQFSFERMYGDYKYLYEKNIRNSHL